MEHLEKQIISLRGFSHELQKEAAAPAARAGYGVLNAARNAFSSARSGFNNPAGRSAIPQSVRKGMVGAGDAGRVAPGTMDTIMNKSRAVGQHVGRNKFSYGAGTGAVGMMGVNSVMS